MQNFKNKTSSSRARFGFTMVEVLLVVALVGIMFTAITPYFSTLNTTWTVFEAQSEQLQNARVALDYFRREFKQAYRVNSITDDSNGLGRLSFEKPNGTVVDILADNSGSEMTFAMIDAGITYDIAGPINVLNFAGFDENNNTTNITALIQSVEMSIAMDNSTVSSNVYRSRVALKRRGLSALHYAVFADDNIDFDGTGDINGNVHANDTLDESGGTITVAGSKTDSAITSAIEFPTVSINAILSDYSDFTAYEAIADVVVTSSLTFTSGNYTGIYYIDNGASAILEEGVILNGSIIAEGDISLTGDGITITPSPNVPAVAAAGNVNISGGFSVSMLINGTIYTGDTLNAFINGLTVNGNGRYNLAIAAEVDVMSACLAPTFTGTVLSGNDQGYNIFSTATFIGSNTLPVIVAGNDLLLNSLGSTADITGIVYVVDDFFAYNANTNISGSLLTNDDIVLDSNMDITYDPSYLRNPPIYMW